MFTRKLIIAGALSIVLAGCGGSESEDLQALLSYVEDQVDALAPIVAGDLSQSSVDEAIRIAENARRHTNPGNADGEWVGELVWMSPPGPCQEHLEADGASPAESIQACRVAGRLWAQTKDLEYWTDESNAEFDEFWDEDRPDYFERSLPEAFTNAIDLIG